MQSMPVASLMPKTAIAPKGGSEGTPLVNGLAINAVDQKDFSAILLAQLLGGASVPAPDVLPLVKEKVFFLNDIDPKLASENPLAQVESSGLPVLPDASLFVLPVFSDKTVVLPVFSDKTVVLPAFSDKTVVLPAFSDKTVVSDINPELPRSKGELTLLEVGLDSQKADSDVTAEFAVSGKIFPGFQNVASAVGKPVELKVDDKVPGVVLAASEGRDDVDAGSSLPDVALAVADSRIPDQSKNLLPVENQPVSTPMVRLNVEPPVAPPIEGKSTVLAVQPPVGNSNWGESFSQKVVWMVGQQQQVAEMKLNPPHLGPMEVRLTVNNDQVTAMFVSHHASVREAIEAAMPRLREMFADSGMTLGNAMVSSESFSRQQTASQDQRSNSSPTSRPEFSAAPDDPVLHRGVLTLRPDSGGLLDFFV
ncbi:MAG: flagellar hook-length control protein FliK [Sulfuricellaceae bacterium]|nr:flagellar hook-length control protein FliK [Sulfuricellaceae bacterium]